MKPNFTKAFTLASFVLVGPLLGIEHGSLEIVQLNNTNQNQTSSEPGVAVTIGNGSTQNFLVRGYNKGDTDMAFSKAPDSDPENGVMITSVTQNSRNNGSGGGRDGISYAVAGSEFGTSGFYIPVHATSGGVEDSGSEYNINVAAGWFPYAEGWLTAHVKNGANLGPLDLMIGSPGIALGKEIIDDERPGIIRVDLSGMRSHGVAATPSNGVLLAIGGENKNNFAMVRGNSDGTFSISVMDAGAEEPQDYEQEGAAFVYLPVSAAGQGQLKALGRVRNDSTTAIQGGDFSVSKQGEGQWLLQIAGESDQTGTLLVSAEGGYAMEIADQPLPNHTNNFVTYEWDVALQGWIIQSRDLPTAALQDGATPDEEMFGFAFFTSDSNLPEPVIVLETPSTAFSIGRPATLRANVSLDGPARIEGVEFFVNGVSVGTATAEPFAAEYTPHTFGPQRIEAFATSSDGVVSGAMRLTVLAEAFIEAPVIPGYSAAILNGGELESTGLPDTPANWQVLFSTPAPYAFSSPGTTPGEPSIRIDGAPVAFEKGILLGTNYAGNDFSDATSRGPIDNNIVPFRRDGNFAVAVDDNENGNSSKPSVVRESSQLSLGFFPYSDGWTGANVAEDLQIIGSSSHLPEGIQISNPSIGIYEIEGLPLDGNLVATSVGDGSDNFVSVGQRDARWVITQRDNSEKVENGPFGFLFVPASSRQVLSGSVANDGSVTARNEGLAAIGATGVATPNGYEITFGDGTRINPETAALFVTPDFDAGNGGDNIYSYYANGNKFVVFSHDLPGLSGAFQTGGFRFIAAPFSPTSLKGDEVDIAVSIATATEGTEDARLEFSVSRLGNPSQALTVQYQLSGSALNGVDYRSLSGNLTFEAGSATAKLMVEVLEDSMFELDESVTVTIVPGAGYSVGLNPSASGTILNAASIVPVISVEFQEGVAGYSGQFSKFLGKNDHRSLDPTSGSEVFGVPTYVDILGRNVSSSYVDGYPGHRSVNGSGAVTDSPDINAVIRFDNLFGNGAGQIPPGAKIAKAELKLTTANGANSRSPGPFIIDDLIMAVTETTTYEDLNGGSGFEGVRGASYGAPLAAFGAMTNSSVESGDVTQIVRRWADNPEAINGFSIFTGGTVDGWEFYTEGNANLELRPKLVVSYVNAETETYIFRADQSSRLVGQSASADGASINLGFIDQETGKTQEALLRFPVAFGEGFGSIPDDEEIVRAELVLTTGSVALFGSANAQSPGPIALHRMLVDWTPDSEFGYFGPQVDQEIAAASVRFGGLGQNSTAYADVTAMVQAWRSGQPNYGLNVKPETTDGWQMFFPGSTTAGTEPQLRIVTAKTVTGSTSGFDEWALSHGIAGAAYDSDGDMDGISALMEYALGHDPQLPEELPALKFEAGTLSLVFEKGSVAGADPRLIYRLQESGDLEVWTDLEATVSTPEEISLTRAVGSSAEFFRLRVIYVP